MFWREDPVLLVESGESYDREAIEAWLVDHSQCFRSGVALETKKVAPNMALQRTVQIWLANNPSTRGSTGPVMSCHLLF